MGAPSAGAPKKAKQDVAIKIDETVTKRTCKLRALKQGVPEVSYEKVCCAGVCENNTPVTRAVALQSRGSDGEREREGERGGERGRERGRGREGERERAREMGRGMERDGEKGRRDRERETEGDRGRERERRRERNRERERGRGPSKGARTEVWRALRATTPDADRRQ